jgi:hypothetical protein
MVAWMARVWKIAADGIHEFGRHILFSPQEK